MNPDENVGGMLKTLVRTLRPSIMSQDVLSEALQLAYDIMADDRQFFINLVKSMPKRLSEVAAKGGGHSTY